MSLRATSSAVPRLVKKLWSFESSCPMNPTWSASLPWSKYQTRPYEYCARNSKIAESLAQHRRDAGYRLLAEVFLSEDSKTAVIETERRVDHVVGDARLTLQRQEVRHHGPAAIGGAALAHVVVVAVVPGAANDRIVDRADRGAGGVGSVEAGSEFDAVGIDLVLGSLGQVDVVHVLDRSLDSRPELTATRQRLLARPGTDLFAHRRLVGDRLRHRCAGRQHHDCDGCTCRCASHTNRDARGHQRCFCHVAPFRPCPSRL